MMKLKKKNVLMLSFLLMVLILNSCGIEGRLRGTYISEDSKTTVVFERVLYLLTENGDYIINYKYNPTTNEIIIGENRFSYSLSDDGKTLQFDNDVYKQTQHSLAMTWRIVKACMQKFGILRWLVCPYFYDGRNTFGNYGFRSAIVAEIAIVILLIIIGEIITNIMENRSYKKRK